MSLITSLIDYWKFDEISGSSVKNYASSNDGTWQGTLGSQWVAGQINNGGNYNGTDNTVSTPINNLPTSDLTIALWANENAGNTGRTFGYEDDTQGNDGLAMYFPTPTTPTIIMRNAGTAYDTGWGTITTGTWHYYVAVISSTQGLSLYLDGVKTNTNANGKSFTFPAGIIFHIGGSGNAGSFFKGIIDEVAIWSRPITTPEVTLLYNMGAGLQYPFPLPGTESPPLSSTTASDFIQVVNDIEGY